MFIYSIMCIILKTAMLIYQFKATSDEKISLVKSFIFKIPKLETYLKGVCIGIEDSTFHSDP